MEYWTTYIFQYIIGGLFFTFGIVVAVVSGTLKLQPKESKQYLVYLCAGVIGYAILHGLWTYAAIQ